MSERVDYDEFAYFEDNAAEFGLAWNGPPTVGRTAVEVEDGRRISALAWGTGEPDLVLFHGGAQNAHTWDTVALALDRPLVAVDLPGHGHSDGGRNGSLDIEANAADLATVIERRARPPVHLVGMSLGGLTALAVAGTAPHLVRSVLLVDVTPGVSEPKTSAITAFINGPERFADFDELLARTIEFNPTRSVSSLRRGILHNAVQEADGSWVWRYARFRTEGGERPDYSGLWDVVSELAVPLGLARGMRDQSVVDDADEDELRRRRPDARVEHFPEAGHSLQGDTPVELAALIDDFTSGA